MRDVGIGSFGVCVRQPHPFLEDGRFELPDDVPRLFFGYPMMKMRAIGIVIVVQYYCII
jgi:hypothetical protein